MLTFVIFLLILQALTFCIESKIDTPRCKKITDFGTTPPLFNLGYAVSVLQRQTGITQLDAEPILLEGDDISIPSPDNRDAISDKERTILAVCSNLRKSFRNRPSQAQMDHLKQILGTEEDPKWWRADPSVF